MGGGRWEPTPHCLEGMSPILYFSLNANGRTLGAKVGRNDLVRFICGVEGDEVFARRMFKWLLTQIEFHFRVFQNNGREKASLLKRTMGKRGEGRKKEEGRGMKEEGREIKEEGREIKEEGL